MMMMIEPEIGTNLGVLGAVTEKKDDEAAPDDPKDLAGDPVKTARIVV